MPGRREQVLDAAVQVLGEQGTRALTHRAVDARGNLPSGTTSNYFRTRDALLAGILGYLFERETAAFATLAGAPRPVSVDELAGRVGALLRQLAGPARTLTLARHAIFLEAAHQEALRVELLEWSSKLWAWAGEWLAAVGSGRPEKHARQLLAYGDGLLLDRLARGGDDEFAPEASLAALLRALVADD
ncbi:TetR/AcrR family transcriptional regulator [Cryptosporangium aurantiacum]|uniref:Transcriptional regulator, TetR family n=1 Tax=Cryptosporangium aurantiacum TaxID=134849 RepID=A0A1M7RF10_9ACTN|nr:TetR/AcrR family transcriptional regulator [Cryptosporangium aurantiacum]SHN44618.1 transcriptional regulator, TetR family [Cryptosporangium aurantiacum]